MFPIFKEAVKQS